MTTPAIYVLGMHRSGTSALSRVLTLLGYAQAKTLMKANDYNPLGYWEPQPVVALNDAYLWDLKRYWGDPKPFDLAADLPRYDRAVMDAEQVLAQQYDLEQGFVVKDPRVSLTFPAWREATQRQGGAPMALIALRNPISVCRSLRTRNGIKIAHAEKLWFNYTLEAERRTRGVARAVVRYEQLLSDWRATIAQTFDTLGCAAPTPVKGKRAAIDDFLDAGLDHGEATDADLADNGHISVASKTLYRLLSQPDGLARREELDSLRADWNALWAEKSKGRGPSFYVKRFPDWHLRQSAQLMDSGDVAGAIAACEDAIEVAPDLAQSHFRLAKLHYDQGDFQRALAPICAAVEHGDGRIHMHMLHARILDHLERHLEALEQVDRALTCNAAWAEGHFLRGQILTKLGSNGDAVDALEQAVALGPETTRFQKALERARAAHDSERAPKPGSKVDPKAAKIAQGLRYLNDKNWRAANTVYADLAQDAEAAFSTLHNYATVLMRLGMVAQAVQTLERLVSLDPQSARHHFLLGAQRTLAGDWAGATQAREAGLKLGGPQVQAFLSADADANAADVPQDEAPNPFMAQSVFAWQSAGHWHRSLQSLPADAPAPLWPKGHKRPNVTRPVIAKTCATERPELSVMIPVYNVRNEAWLRGAIESVLGQTDPSEAVEVMVVDDASSTDVARDIAADYGGRVGYHLADTQGGLVGNHNRCLNLATGEFVHILHQDDWVRGGFYDALLTPLRADKSLAMAFCAARIVDSKDNRVRVPAQLGETAGVLQNWTARIVHGQLINFPTVIARRSAYEAVGGFTPSLSFAFDWEMWARLSTAGQVWHDPAELAVYRNHAGSATQLFSARERLIDTFHTIAGVLPLLDPEQADQIARHALHRVLANGWGQLRQMDSDTQGLPEMVSFLSQGCDSGVDVARIMALFE